MKVTKIKGTLDFYQSDAKKYRYLQKIASGVAESFGFREMITPIFEATEVFVRSVGEGSDIVNKEMYTFIDRGDRSITLRPEGTAPVTRAFVENKLYAVPGIHKYYYFGPMFRYERPQAGRLRQFTQFGVEAFGGEHPYLDADIINLNYQILQALGIKNIKVLINSIGSGLAREKYVEALKKHFEPHLSALCDDCKQRFQKNTLRMLDCKVDSQNPVMQSAPII
ncbi:MAG TPA: histidine--tRNA ligase, partial [Bacilli bacterium]|nr:histidine--tRNA ligase [Bacilli bacterium]